MRELRSARQTAFRNCIQHVVSIHAVIVTLDAAPRMRFGIQRLHEAKAY